MINIFSYNATLVLFTGDLLHFTKQITAPTAAQAAWLLLPFGVVAHTATMDQTQQAAAPAAAAASAAVQQMAEVLQPTLSSAMQKSTTLPPFWPHNPTGWFQLAEAEMAAAHYPPEAHSCYI